MRIEQISLENFRQYRSSIFSFEAPHIYDLFLIIGKNGTGKSNLLNAITWCLYDIEPHLSKASDAEARVNGPALEAAHNAGEEICIVAIVITIVDGEKVFKFERRQEFTTESITEPYGRMSSFCITETNPLGNNQIYTNRDETRMLVNRYVPEDIREYFFFDNEQLEKYFVDSQGENIRNAIFNISQVRLLQSMKDRLITVISEMRRTAGSNNEEIEHLNNEISAVDKRIKDLSDWVAKLKSEINESDKIILANQEFLRGKFETA